MEELLTKQQRGTKEYLLEVRNARVSLLACRFTIVSQTVSPVIVEAMAVLAVERPQNPVAWLASFALAHSELAEELVIVRK